MKLRHINVLLALLLGVAALAETSYADIRIVYVQVRASKLRTAPQHWASAIADLNYGQSLEVLENSKGWIKVRSDAGAEGFIPASAVTEEPLGTQLAQNRPSEGLALSGLLTSGSSSPEAIMASKSYGGEKGGYVYKGSDEKDIQMASKGFNKGVEAAYARKNPQLNYAEVNRMERAHKISDGELKSFVKSGKLG